VLRLRREARAVLLVVVREGLLAWEGAGWGV
jgi:hypothetical protein